MNTIGYQTFINATCSDIEEFYWHYWLQQIRKNPGLQLPDQEDVVSVHLLLLFYHCLLL
jgi:hypothetical protein